MPVIDLSHPLSSTMPVYPGTPQPRIQLIRTLSDDGFRETEIYLTSHTGTHLDAPSHVLAQGQGLASLPAASFYGDACCIMTKKASITADFLSEHQETIIGNDILLLATGWDRHWGHESYYSGYPVLEEEAARFLCQFSLKGIGFDTISADAAENEQLPIHKILLRKMYIIENLTGLSALSGIQFTFSCFPLNIGDCDGAPVRAVAFTEDPHQKLKDS